MRKLKHPLFQDIWNPAAPQSHVKENALCGGGRLCLFIFWISLGQQRRLTSLRMLNSFGQKWGKSPDNWTLVYWYGTGNLGFSLPTMSEKSNSCYTLWCNFYFISPNLYLVPRVFCPYFVTSSNADFNLFSVFNTLLLVSLDGECGSFLPCSPPP